MNVDAIPESPAARAFRLALEARSEAIGRLAGAAGALVLVITARGLELDDAVRARIAACPDSAVLQRWIANAATATNIDQVFDVGP